MILIAELEQALFSSSEEKVNAGPDDISESKGHD